MTLPENIGEVNLALFKNQIKSNDLLFVNHFNVAQSALHQRTQTS